ncbi:hypothetical protein [Streptomyces sp. URMC 123]|uniref:hypothetical protein n=1 Tax=Streptomyces sp. URMC 123 TaxID=3423403 RepID=UPI003F1B5530
MPAPRPGARTGPRGWAEGAARVRAAAPTEPGRLRLVGAALAALVVAFGALTAWQVSERAAAADDVVHRSQRLSNDAADIYRSLADADTTAAAGFLAGPQEPRDVRERFERDIARASELLVRAAAATGGSGPAHRRITELNERLPVYTGLVETARATNRQGLPLGGAYLRHANAQMRSELLPAAAELYEEETARLDADYADARAWPWAALGLGALALAGLAAAQRREFLRTNRVFNQGLVGASAATAVILLWLVAGHAVADGRLADSRDQGAVSLRVLTTARIDALRARGDEALTLVARGAVLNESNEDFYEAGYRSGMARVIGDAPSPTGTEAGTGTGDGANADDGAAEGSLLGRARKLADDAEGREPVREAIEAVRQWQDRHREARAADEAGSYDQALAKVIGGKGTTGESFDRVDAGLDRALAHERREFELAANDGRGALAGLPAGAIALAVLGAAAAVLGIGRRLAEYR